MQEIPAKYDPSTCEDRWYAHWMSKNYFHSTPDEREPYTIVIPPPNVTGVLHMGHMLNNTIQDVLVRRARMMGKNACWVPGTDHASIATESKVVNKLAAEGISKADLTRQEFLKHAWQWTDKHGGIILEQLKKMGASCDWERTKFTMDDDMSESVIKTFVDLHQKGLVYRGVRMVNWDPKALTALSDEEVVFQEQQGKLYYLRYKVQGDEGTYAVVATTRPETIMGDTAMCINPNDEKNKHLKGKSVIVPLVGRVIPVIEDDYVDIEFGTGCLKVTPAHDVNDYMLGEKYNLPSIDIFEDDGTLSTRAELYVGMDRFEVRKQIVKDLDEAGLLEKVEDYTNKVGTSERSGAVIEPKLSMQWFLSMENLAKPALDAVMNDDVKFHPAKYKNTYKYWMENIKDWCVSRQLWWGQQIPAYYLPEGGYVVAETPEKALVKAQQKNPALTMADLRQDPDVLDTWFSSWIWPLSVFDGVNNPDNEDVKYYYPTADLVTAPDIMFFWVARMIMTGFEYKQEIPFSNVFFTGTVRDSQRRKMSKSLGNSPDPLDLIAKYGADSMRVAMMLCSTAGNDIIWDESLIEQGRNFGNKIWNTFRLISMWEQKDIEQPESAKTATLWFENLLNKTIAQINEDFKAFRISDALMKLYRLFWDDFSASYLELIKPAYGEPIDNATYAKTIEFYQTLLQQLHPYMPFITEEIYHFIKPRTDDESIMISLYDNVEEYNEEIIERMTLALEVVTAVRSVRAQKNISPKEMLTLMVVADKNYHSEFNSAIVKLSNVDVVEITDKPEAAVGFIVKTTEYFVPLEGAIDPVAEKARLEKELKYFEGFMVNVEKKLSNERFVSSAPEKVVELEKQKLADATAKINAITKQLKALC